MGRARPIDGARRVLAALLCVLLCTAAPIHACGSRRGDVVAVTHPGARRRHAHAHDEAVVPAFLRKRLEAYDRVPIEAHRSANGVAPRRALASAASPHSLRILVYFDDVNFDLPAEETKTIKERLTPLLTDILTGALTVRRPQAGPSLLLPRTCLENWADGTCKTVAPIEACMAVSPPADWYGPTTTCANGPSSLSRDCQTVPGGSGVGDVDFVVMISSVSDIAGQTACEASTFAFGTPCEFSPIDGRPLAGSINICPQVFKSMGVGDALVGEQLDVLLHESLHSLGLNSWMYARYVDDSGATMGESRVLMTDADGKPWLTTPRVTAAARAWYGCDTMPGMRLEDNGGAGTAMSHWEKSLVGNELMAGSTDGDRMVLSALTLAHLSDTGWYTADMSQARTSGYGRDAGCDWVADPCTPGRKYCQKADYGETRESYDEHKYGVCQEMDLEPACPEVVMLRRGACYDGFNNSKQSSSALMYYGPRARAFELASGASWQPTGTATVWPDSVVCLETECSADGKSVYIVLSGKRMRCPGGTSLKLPWKFVGVLRGELSCPDQATIEKDLCPGLTCSSDCSAAGVCINGACQCFVGRTGSDCSGWAVDIGVKAPGPYGVPIYQNLFGLAVWWSWLFISGVAVCMIGLGVFVGRQLVRPSEAQERPSRPGHSSKHGKHRSAVRPDPARKDRPRAGREGLGGRTSGTSTLPGDRREGSGVTVANGQQRQSMPKPRADGQSRGAAPVGPSRLQAWGSVQKSPSGPGVHRDPIEAVQVAEDEVRTQPGAASRPGIVNFVHSAAGWAGAGAGAGVAAGAGGARDLESGTARGPSERRSSARESGRRTGDGRPVPQSDAPRQPRVSAPQDQRATPPPRPPRGTPPSRS